MKQERSWAILMPLDIARHPDGTPVRAIKFDDKKKFIIWWREQGKTPEDWDKLSGKEKEEIHENWRTQNGIK